MSLYRNGIEHKGQWFAVLRPDGRLSGRMFRCPYRAAEHAMRGFGVALWPELVKRGIRIVAVREQS
jgi:NAD(P)-dependent dehydrogenase (short-subunit alcohol dehydrogenase family)